MLINGSVGAASFAEHLFYAANYGMALLVGATFVLALRHGVIPRWLAWVGAVGGVLLLVAIWPFFIFGGLIFLFWVAALSFVLMGRIVVRTASGLVDKT